MSGSIYNGEVLDLRELILVLWRRKWLILGIPLLVGLLVLLVNSTLVPKRYQSTSFITITDPKTRGEIEPYGFPEIAESVELIQLTFSELGINDLVIQDIYEFSSSIKSRGQLQLTVTSDDPVLAAEAANIWAVILAHRLNEIYGTSEESLEILAEQTSDAEGIWTAAQTKLEKFLAESSIQIYPAQISVAQSTLEDTMREIDFNQLLISDVQALVAQIQAMDSTNPLPLGIVLSLVNFQVRSANVQLEFPSEIQIDNSFSKLDDAVLYLDGLERALQNQNQQLEEMVMSLKDEISELNLSLEEERNQETQLKLDRDQAKSTYVILASNLEEGKIHQTQEQFNIKVSAKAIPAQEAISSNLLINIGFASISSCLLTILGSIFHAWWVGRNNALAS